MLLTWQRIAPVPTAPRRMSAGARVDNAAAIAIGAPQSRRPSAKPPASRRRAARAATTSAPADAADAHRGVQPADTRIAAVQEAQREYDEQHLERSLDDCLRGAQSDDHPKSRAAEHSREAGRQLREEPRPLCLRRRLVARDLDDECCRPEEQCRLEREDRGGPLSARRTPPIAGPANMPTLDTVLPTRFAAVSSSGESTRDGMRAACAGARTRRRSSRSPRAGR